MNRRASAAARQPKTINVPLVGSLLSGLCIVFLIAYMYLLSVSVVHVVVRKEVNQAIRAAETDIAALEADFIEAKHRVSERIAGAEELTETNEKIFVTRVPAALVLETARNRE